MKEKKALNFFIPKKEKKMSQEKFNLFYYSTYGYIIKLKMRNDVRNSKL